MSFAAVDCGGVRWWCLRLRRLQQVAAVGVGGFNGISNGGNIGVVVGDGGCVRKGLRRWLVKSAVTAGRVVSMSRV